MKTVKRSSRLGPATNKNSSTLGAGRKRRSRSSWGSADVFGVGGFVFGELRQTAAAVGEDARNACARSQTPEARVRRQKVGGSLGGSDRDVPARSAAPAGPTQDQGGRDREGHLETF